MTRTRYVLQRQKTSVPLLSLPWPIIASHSRCRTLNLATQALYATDVTLKLWHSSPFDGGGAEDQLSFGSFCVRPIILLISQAADVCYRPPVSYDRLCHIETRLGQWQACQALSLVPPSISTFVVLVVIRAPAARGKAMFRSVEKASHPLPPRASAIQINAAVAINRLRQAGASLL